MPEDGTEATEQVTENSESQQTGNSQQEGDALSDKLKQLEEQLKGYSGLDARVKSLQEENRRATAEAMRWQSGYKGLQQRTTEKLQEAAALQRQLSEAQQTAGQLSELRETVNLLARKMLDEDQAKEFDLQQRELRIRQAEAMVQQRAQQPSPQQAQPAQQYVDPDIQRRQYIETFFPGVDIDPNHPDIDWGEGASNQSEAFARWTASVARVMMGQDRKEEQEIKSEAQRLLEQTQAQLVELTKAKDLAIEEAKAQARKDVEERLRKLGIDAGGTSPASASTRKAQVDLNELDETTLYTGEPGSPARKKAQLEYDAKLRAIRNKLLAGA
jgi:DNA repair exonuclease SbcCD ATPase subunit